MELIINKINRVDNLDLKQLGNQIRTARVLVKMSQIKLSELINTSQSTICRMETNPRLVNFGVVIDAIKVIKTEIEKQNIAINIPLKKFIKNGMLELNKLLDY